MVAAAGVLLAACGVGVDAAPNVIGKRSVPYGLTRPAPPTTAAPVPSAYVTIYLLAPQHLVAVSQSVSGPVTVSTVLRALAAGPTDQQAAQGLASPISSAAPLRFDHLVNTVATVDVSSSFTALAQKEQELAAAQLVYSLTAFPGVSSVQIRIHGRLVQVPTGKGTLTKVPLTRSNYASFAPY
jgi:spore germination protein GerM